LAKKLTKEQMAAIKAKESKKLRKKDVDFIYLPGFEKKIQPFLDIETNLDNPIDKYPKKNFKLWVVEHPEGSEKVPHSETVVRSQHYGQAVDDFIIDWNKKKKLNKTIGYPVVQGKEIGGE
jgi:hypothetical protein